MNSTLQFLPAVANGAIDSFIAGAGGSSRVASIAPENVRCLPSLDAPRPVFANSFEQSRLLAFKDLWDGPRVPSSPLNDI